MPAQVDVAMAPPPPTDVQSQMQQGPDPGALLAGLMPAQPPMPPPENMQRILQIQPVLSELALTVPQLAPEISGLVERLKSRLPGGSMLGAGAPQAGGPPGLPPPPGAPVEPPIGPPGMPTGAPPLPMAGMQPIQPQAMPTPTSSGVMGLAQQAEMVLPQIAMDDPTLAPDIQFFTARMRDEVAKVLQAQKGPLNPPPTDEMINKLPVSM